nr:hypothetical protein [Porphyromonas gingivalis]
MLFSTRHAPKFFRLTLLKTWRGKLFGFGAESKKFSRHNEKNLVPFSQKTQTKIRVFLVRIDESEVYCGQKKYHP